MITIDRIDTLEGLRAAETAWNGLLSGCPYRDVYMDHTWVSTWWKHFERDRRLLTLRFQRGRDVMGYAPLMLERKRLRGLPVRQLGFLLNGCSLQSEFVFPRERDEMFRLLVEYLATIDGDWDVVCLDGLSDEAGSLASLERAVAGTSITVAPPVTWETLVVPVAGTWDEYLQERSRKFRKNLWSAERHLQRQGEVRHQRLESPDAMDSALTMLMGIERESWKLEHGEAVSTRESFVDFYREVARRYAERQAFRVHTIDLDGHPVAGLFGIIHDGTAYALRTWYDLRYADYSPGRAVLAAFMRDLWTSGVREICLDRRNRYKESWTTTARRYYKAWLFNRRLYSRAIARVRSMRGSAPAA